MALQFSTTKDGHLAARVAHLTFALLPGRTSAYGVFSHYPAKDPAECVACDFNSHDKEVDDEAGFRAYVQNIYDHYEQVAKLGRRDLKGMIPTPWGPSQTRCRYADGIESVTTASHGGFILAAEQNELIDESWRNRDGAYEEDEAWAIVAFHFPNLFTDREKRFAEDTLKNRRPDEWMRLTGRTLDIKESHALRERAFKLANAHNLVVISALRSTIHTGQVECTATRGGERKFDRAIKFLVPSDEYNMGEFGFVIDESRHPRLDAEGNPQLIEKAVA